MKYIFFGTPDFAALILEQLVAAGMPPVAVVTNPDRPFGRKKILTPPPVKQLIAQRTAHSTILQPENLLTIRDLLFAFGPEVGILAAYGKIIPQEIINIFPKGIVVAHPSLLPRYRGSTPIQSAILNGDTETGTTLFLMDGKIDHGLVLAQCKAQIAHNDTYLALMKKLAEASADLIIDTLPRYLHGDSTPQAQDEARATYTKKFASDDGFVNEASLRAAIGGEAFSEAQSISRMVRALNPEPGVWTIASENLLSSLRASHSNLNARVKLLESEYADGKLILKKIQFEGSTPRFYRNPPFHTNGQSTRL